MTTTIAMPPRSIRVAKELEPTAWTVRPLLSINDLSDAELRYLVGRGIAMRRGEGADSLRGKSVGIWFRKTSTRTRTSFSIGAAKLGAATIAYGPADLQTNTGETVEDTAAVLSGFLDALVIRTAESLAEMRALADQPRMAVVNAMSENEHPTQALADLTTMLEHFGGLEGLRVLYMGEGNNSAAALALSMSRIPGMRLTLLTPAGYGLSPQVLAEAHAYAADSGAVVEESHDPADLPRGVDVVYTTRWQTTGSSKPDPDWRRGFEPFRVTEAVMREAAAPHGVFMHDLPAHRGEEVDASVLDGPRSIALHQAQNKMYSAMAVLEWCVAGPR
jgi:ornithine carbamoyltransferase